MIWSANKPTQPGRYTFARVPSDVDFPDDSAWWSAVVEVYRDVDGHLEAVRPGDTVFTRLDQWPDGSWCAANKLEASE